MDHSDFAEFLKKNGVQHTRASPYHPAINAEAERFVCTFNEAMKLFRVMADASTCTESTTSS